MAFFATIRLMIVSKSLTEPIIRNLLKFTPNVSSLKDEYVLYLKNLNIPLNKHNAFELLEFPYKSFHMFSDIDMKKIIDESFKIIKEKDLASSVSVYNALINSQIDFDIDFDIDTILSEISKKKITFNQDTYKILIKYYAKRGNLDAFESIVSKMKSTNLTVPNKQLMIILSAYYVNGLQEKAQMFIKENNMDENGIYVTLSKAKSYATLGDVNNATKHLFEIYKNDLSFSSKYCFTIYTLLVAAGTPKPQLEKIIKLMKKMIVKKPIYIHFAIQKLNQAKCFDESLIFLKDFLNFVDETTAFYLIELFTIPACPKKVYKNVLKLLLCRIGTTNNVFNAFSNMEFEEAMEFAVAEGNERNIECICKSLINKALREKSLENIETSINFTMHNMFWTRVNLILQHMVLPFAVELKIVSNHEEILSLFPQFNNIFLSVILMNYLTYGKFKEYDTLRKKYLHLTNVPFMAELGYLCKTICDNLSPKEFEQFESEGKKYFTEKCIRNFVHKASFYRIVNLLKTNQDAKEMFSLLERLNYQFQEDDFNFLKIKCPDKIEVFKPFFINTIQVTNS